MNHGGGTQIGILGGSFVESADEVLDNAPCGFISTLPDGTIVSVNRTFLDWTGFDRDDLLAGRRFQDLLITPGEKSYETVFLPLLHTQGFVNEIACHIACGNRGPLPVLVNSRLKTDAAGRPLAIRTTVFNAAERAKYEHELHLAREQADRLATIVTSSADAIYSMTLDGVILTWNMGAETMLGYPASEAVGRHAVDLIVPPDKYEEFAALSARLQLGETQQLDTIRLRRDGTLVDVAASAAPVYDDKETIVAFSVILRDITDKTQIMAALQQSEARFRGTFENAAVGVAHVALDGSWLRVNDTLCQVAGYSRETLLTKTYRNITEPGDLTVELELAQRLMAGEVGSYAVEKRFIGADGSAVWTGVTVTLQRRENGDPAYFIVIIRDIGARVRATEALHESQARLLYAANSAKLSYVVVDLERRWVQASENQEAVMGYATPDFENGIELDRATSIFLDHVVEADRRRVRRFLRQASSGETLPGLDYRVEGDDGRERWIETRYNLEASRYGRAIRFFVTNMDITDRKRTEEHIRLLMGEVNHRAMNLLGVVQAIAWQTAKSQDSKTYVARLAERIGGLAASHDLLVRAELKGVEIAELVRTQLHGFSAAIGTRILVDGPSVRLSPAAAQAIGMALHELATNATKYGALSNSDGRVHVSWQVSGAEDGLFSMSWIESGGPAVQPPTRKGFGQAVIVSMVQSAVSGEVLLEFNESGLSWKLRSPFADTLETEDAGDPAGNT